jgi:hypothetical protein
MAAELVGSPGEGTENTFAVARGGKIAHTGSIETIKYR